MTIGATRRNDANGNDSTATYPYGFKIFAATDLEVKVKKASDGSITTLTYTTHYTVTGVGSANGGNVVLVDVDGAWQNAADGTLKTGYSIAIVRKAPLTQTTDIRNQGGFFAATHEDVFDKLTMLAQRLDDDLGRAVKLDSAYDTTAYNMTLPAPVASSAIGFNAAGTGLAIISSLAGVATTAFTQSLLDDANAEAFIDTLTAGLSAETAPAIGDRLILDDVSAGTWDAITLENLWKVINGFTAIAAADIDAAADKVPVYDASAGEIRAAVINALLPAGSIQDYAGSSVPGGWLECDGSAVSRTTYAALFTAIGTTWGSGDGSTTFNLPDLRGRARISRGTGTMTEAVAAASVTTGDDTFTVAANDDKWITGMKVQVSTTGGLPAGLAAATDYWLVRASSTTIKFATSLANAQNGTVIDLTTQGTGTHTVTHTLTARTLGIRGGEEAHAMSSTELLAHTHSLEGAFVLNGGGSGFMLNNTGSFDNTESKGGNAAMNNMQPYGTVITIIKT